LLYPLSWVTVSTYTSALISGVAVLDISTTSG
jgi:hypothetical protein